MSNMRDKIAIALGEKLGPALSGGQHITLGELTDAVLDALLEPTPEMLSAFHRMCDDNGTCLAKPGFVAMIQAVRDERP